MIQTMRVVRRGRVDANRRIVAHGAIVAHGGAQAIEQAQIGLAPRIQAAMRDRISKNIRCLNAAMFGNERLQAQIERMVLEFGIKPIDRNFQMRDVEAARLRG